MCMYVSSPLSESAPYLVFPTPKSSSPLGIGVIRTGGIAALFGLPAYSEVSSGVEEISVTEGSIANGIYASDRDPSDIEVATDASLMRANGAADDHVYLDQLFSVGSADSGYSKAVETTTPTLLEYMKRGFVGDGDGRFFGWSSCHWLRACDPVVDRPGSTCNATQSGVAYLGYCFVSDTQSLECGHLTALDDRYGQKPVAFDARAAHASRVSGTSPTNGRVVSPSLLPSDAGVVPSTTSSLQVLPSTPGESRAIYRCPTGSPARGLGSYVSKRLLIAGCMISSDASFDYLAEVHVPAYCAIPTDYRPGCLVPWALNFDAMAKQSAMCKFHNRGCTSSTALNYNSEATMDDPEHSCIEPIRGCTLPSLSYAGVAPETPAYRSNFYGSAIRGKVLEDAYFGPATMNYNREATVNEGCVLAIEGCMDSTAVNYDSEATTNSMSWCIPRIVGCMMPAASNASPHYHNPNRGGADGLNANFSIEATVHTRGACVIARYGCTEVARPARGFPAPMRALNYDAMATVATKCYWPRSGCLHPSAINFGCDTADSLTPCNLVENVTEHQPQVCRYLWDITPSAPRPPSAPPGSVPSVGGRVRYKFVVRFWVDGTAEYFSEPVRASAILAFKRVMEMPDLDVNLTVQAGSAELEYASLTDGADTADELVAIARLRLGSSSASLQSSLGDAIGVRVLTAAQVTKETTIDSGGLDQPRLGLGVWVGIATGSAAGAVLFVATMCRLCCHMKLELRKPIYIYSESSGHVNRIHPE